MADERSSEIVTLSAQCPLRPPNSGIRCDALSDAMGHHRTHACSRIDDKKQCEHSSTALMRQTHDSLLCTIQGCPLCCVCIKQLTLNRRRISA